MKCIILFTLVAVCYSYPYGIGVGKNVNINDDGTIAITQATGKKIIINKGIQSFGQTSVDITVSGLSQVVVNVPVGVDEQGKQVVPMVLIPRFQVATGLGQWGVSNAGGLGVSGQLGGIVGIARTPLGIRDLLTGGQLGQVRWGQVGGINEPISTQLEEVIEAEREILDEQRQIQQQQLQQQQQQQEVLVQQLIQQRQQQQQQRQQQLVQQLQQQQLQQQEALLQQQKQQLTGGNSLLNGGWPGIQSGGQLGLWQQQPGAYSQGGLVGGFGQNIPVIGRIGVPLIL